MDAMAMRFAHVGVVFFLCLLHIAGTSSGLMITIRSSCGDTVWPAIVSKPHSLELIVENMTGFALRTGESNTVSAPDKWAGTVWGRTHCKIDAAGKFTCGTGDCGSYAVECPGGGGGASVPAATTLVDFTPNGGFGEYTYSVSLAKGFNLPVIVVPGGVESRSNSCNAVGCVADLNKDCPKEVQVVLIGNNNSVIGCNSACEVFKESKDHYCGRASTYSDYFKGLCPNAQAFENDKTSNTTFECSSTDYYDVHFCAFSFPSTPPISELLRASSPDGYEDIPGEKVLTDDSGSSTHLVVKITLGCVFSVVGLSLGYALWCRNDDPNISLSLKISNYGRIICSCCNCFNTTRISAPPDAATTAAPNVPSAHPHRGVSASNRDPQPNPQVTTEKKKGKSADKDKEEKKSRPQDNKHEEEKKKEKTPDKDKEMEEKKKKKSPDKDKEMKKRPPQDRHKEEEKKEKSPDKDKEMKKRPPQDKHKEEKKQEKSPDKDKYTGKIPPQDKHNKRKDKQ